MAKYLGLKVIFVLVFFLSLSNISYANSYNNNRLLSAATRGDTNIVKDALSKGANIDARDRLGNTALILASDGGYQEIVRLLLDEGAAVNALNIYGYTPLLSAVTNSHRYIASMLIKAGADAKIPNKYGTTATMYIKALGFFTIEEYINFSATPAVTTVTDNRPQRRGQAGGIHNNAWREKFNTFVSEGKSKQAADHLVKSAESGYKDAQFLLGSLLLESENKKDAIYWLKKAAENADSDMLYEIGRLLTSEDTKYDMEFGLDCILKSSELGNELAKIEYGKILLLENKQSEAYAIFESTASNGNPEGEYYQGVMLYAGKGVPENEVAGMALIDKSAKAGNLQAKLFVGQVALEKLITRIANSNVTDRAMLHSDLISMGIQQEKINDNCSIYILHDVFNDASGINKLELCYPGDGTAKATYYLTAAANKDIATYLKNLSNGTAEFLLP